MDYSDVFFKTKVNMNSKLPANAEMINIVCTKLTVKLRIYVLCQTPFGCAYLPGLVLKS